MTLRRNGCPAVLSSAGLRALAIVTHTRPSSPSEMLSGKAGRLVIQGSWVPSLSHTRSTQYRPVCATARKSSVSATPFANCRPSTSTSTAPSGSLRSSRPVPECSMMSAVQCSRSNRWLESVKYTVPSAATAALLHTRRPCSPLATSVVKPSGPSSRSPCSASQMRIPSGCCSNPRGRPPVSATTSICQPSKLTFTMRPSSSPV